MTRRIITRGLLAITLLLGCGDDDDVGMMIDPTDVEPDDLYGYWTFIPPMVGAGGGNGVTFGFARPEDATSELPLAENMIAPQTEPVAAVYDGAPPSWTLEQLTTFSVEDGNILQTVLRGAEAPPGTMYSTEIFDFAARSSMTIASRNDPSGRRTYTWSERCRTENPAGWRQFNGLVCPNFVSTGTSLFVDRFGDVHVVNGTGTDGPPSCPPQPTFSDMTRACVPRQSEWPNLKLSAMTATDDDVLRVAYLRTSSNVAENDNLVIAERPLRGDTWTRTVIDAAPPGAGAYLEWSELPSGPALLFVGTNASVALYHDEGSTFRKEMLDVAGILPRDAAIGADGRLVVAGNNGIARQTATGFERIDMPPGARATTSVHVDSQNRVHAIFDVGDVGERVRAIAATYGIYEDDEWTLRSLGPLYNPMIATEGDGPLQVFHHVDKASRPALALTTLLDEGGIGSILLAPGASFSPMSSPENFVQSRLHRGADGTFAATFDGAQVYVRDPMPPRVESKRVTIAIEGEGSVRVRSLDGLVDCDDDCEVMVPLGTRLPIAHETPIGTAVTSVSSCLSSDFVQFGYCWVDVSDDVEVRVAIQRSPILDIFPLGDTRGTAVATRFATRQRKLALAVAFNPGVTDFPIVGTTFTRPDEDGMEALAVWDRDSRAGWVRSLPVAPLAIAPTDDGGAFALISVASPTAIDGMTVGASARTTPVRLRFDAEGDLMAATALTDVSSSEVIAIVAGEITYNGTAVAVATSTGGFPSMSHTERSLALHIDAAGTQTVTPLDTPYLESAVVAIEGARTVIGGARTGGSDFFVIDGANVSAQVLDGGAIQRIAIGSEATYGLFAVTGTFAGESGPFVLTTHGGNGAVARSVSLADADMRSLGLAAVAGGAIVLDGPRARRFDGSLNEIGGQDLPFTGQVFAAGPAFGALGVLLYQGRMNDYPIPELGLAFSSLVVLAPPED